MLQSLKPTFCCAESGVCHGDPDALQSFYSENGNIRINGSNAAIDGILYAPKGEIRFNGARQTINGRVIGNIVTFNGNGISIHGGTQELKSIPKAFVKLKK